jgi:predicted kinase
MPFTCDACGRGTFPDLIPPIGDVLRCPHCADERRFARPSLLVVTGTVGVGKSTLCARLAGTIPGAVLIDADIFAEDLVSVVPPSEDYPAFWRSMMRLAHEVAQNNVVVVYFSVMRPDQLLANSDILGYFHSVNFLCLTCSPNVLRARLARREPDADPARFERWVDFNCALAEAVSDIPTADVLDAGRSIDQVEHEVRDWIKAHL